MTKVLMITILFFSLIGQLCTQPVPAELKKKISGKKNLKAIMLEVEKFYENEEYNGEKQKQLQAKSPNNEREEFESGLLHWKRWEYFNSTRLKPNGDIEDVAAKTITAWEKVNRKYETISTLENGAGPALQSGTNANWSFVGPSGLQYQGGQFRGLSKVDRIVFHPTDPNTFYACSNNGGLWRTQNGGASWTNMTFHFPIQSVSGVAINPDNPSNLFVITGDPKGGGRIAQNSSGIWVTNDGGITWLKTSFNSDPLTTIYGGYKIVIMPGLSYIIFAATQNGLFRSTNSGISWSKVINQQIYDVEFDPAEPGRVYASGNRTFYLSENFGTTFPPVQQSNIPGATRIEIGVSPANSNYVYLLCGPFTPNTLGSSGFAGIYRSSSKGIANSFVLRANSPNILCNATNGIIAQTNEIDQSGYDLAIDVNKTNAERIIVAGKIVWTSPNGGTTLTNLTLYNEGNTNAVPPANYIHPDIQDIQYNPLNNNLYACTDGGVYLSANGGTIWSNIGDGIFATTFYHMAGARFDLTRILGGAQDNGVKYKSGIGDFKHITGADGFDCAFGPSASSSIYATVNSGVTKFDINGTGQSVATPVNTALFPVIAADPVIDNILYLAGGQGVITSPICGVQKSIDGGSSWKQVLSQAIQQSICTCPNNANRIYASGRGSIFRSDDGGDNWTLDLALNPGFINNKQITDINVCSSNSDYVYVTTGGYMADKKVFYSNDAGANWLNISGTLPAEVKVNCVVVDDGNNAYIGTDMGVYYQAVNSSDWTPFFNNLPRIPVTDLAIQQNSGRIRAATYGFGIWEADLFTTCDENFNLSGTVAGNRFFQASNMISSNATITGGNVTNITTRAGKEIFLQDGFTVFENNIYNGFLGACESGPVPQLAGRGADIPPLFIKQVDKGNDTTLYPYGTITVNLPGSKENATILLHAIVPGDFLITITDKNDLKEFVHFDEHITSAKNISRSIPVGNFQKGKYYVLLFYKQTLVQVQELVVQ